MKTAVVGMSVPATAISLGDDIHFFILCPDILYLSNTTILIFLLHGFHVRQNTRQGGKHKAGTYLPEILCIDNPANTILLVSFLLSRKSLVCQCLLNLVQCFFQLREFPTIYPFSNLTFLSLP